MAKKSVSRNEFVAKKNSPAEARRSGYSHSYQPAPRDSKARAKAVAALKKAPPKLLSIVEGLNE